MYRIVVLGSGDLFHGVLQGLLESQYEIAGVLQWESVANKTNWRSSIKRKFINDGSTLIDRHSLFRLRPCKANSEQFVRQIIDLAPDILLVAGWGEILSANTIDLPKVACINVHPSLLPTHRGFNPVSSVLCAGEGETGISFHYVTTTIDGGDIILQSSIEIFANDNGDSLARKLSFRAKEMVVSALSEIQNSNRIQTPQNHHQASYYPKLTRADAQLDWSCLAENIHNQVRGCFPWINSFTYHNGNKLMVLRTEVLELYRPEICPGKILSKLGTQLVIATGDPLRAILVTDTRLPKKLGSIKGKLYVARSITLGDLLE